MKLSNKFMAKKVGEDYMIIPLVDNSVSMKSVFDINESGYFIYSLLEKAMNEEEIANEMVKEYDIDLVTARADLAEFLAKLIEKGILE